MIRLRLPPLPSILFLFLCRSVSPTSQFHRIPEIIRTCLEQVNYAILLLCWLLIRQQYEHNADCKSNFIDLIESVLFGVLCCASSHPTNEWKHCSRILFFYCIMMSMKRRWVQSSANEIATTTPMPTKKVKMDYLLNNELLKFLAVVHMTEWYFCYCLGTAYVVNASIKSKTLQSTDINKRNQMKIGMMHPIVWLPWENKIRGTRMSLQRTSSGCSTSAVDACIIS